MSGTNSMKKLLVILLLLAPSVALATPSSVDRVTDHIEPLIKTDFTRSQYFIATSTTVASTLPYASTTALSSSKLTSGSCVQAGTGGLLINASGPCTSGTVTSVSVATANGFAGSSSGGATPALTLTTTVSGVLKGNGTAISAAANGVDYTLLTAKTCNAGDFVSAGTAAGVLTCTTPAGTTYTGTFPIAVSGSVISFGGLSTSSPAVVGNIPYFSGANTFANVATSTLTPSSPLTGSFTHIGTTGSLGCQTASGSQAGCLSSADWTTFNGKGSGTVTSIVAGTGLSGGTITSTGNISLLSYLATSTGETSGQLSYWTTTNGTPAKLASIATSSETCSSPLSCTAHTVLTGGGAITCATCLTANQSITLTGAVTGSGSTAITTAFGAAAANTVLANITGASAVPTFAATSSLFTGTVGQNAYFSGTGTLVGTSSLFVALSSNIGIGTTTPDSTLTVYNSGTIPPLHLISDGGNIQMMNLDEYVNASNGGGGILGRAARGTLTSPSAVQVGDRLGYALFGGYTGSGFSNVAGLTIGVDAGTVSATSLPSYIAFLTTPDGSVSRAERLRIDENGKVGIGTASPSQILNIKKDQDNSTILTLENLSAGASAKSVVQVLSDNNSQLQFTNFGSGNTTSRWGMTMGNWSEVLGGVLGNGMAIGTFGATPLVLGTNSTAVMTITSGGNVGVGTTTPWRKLSVTGTVGFDGLTSAAGVQVGFLCLSANKEVINDSVACLVSSGRYKQDVNTLAPANALAEILALRPVSFTYKPDFNGTLQDDPNYSGVQTGLIAEEVVKVDSRLIAVDTATSTFEGKTYGPGTPSSVKYDSVVPVLIGALQEQQREIEALQAAIKKLQK